MARNEALRRTVCPLFDVGMDPPSETDPINMLFTLYRNTVPHCMEPTLGDGMIWELTSNLKVDPFEAGCTRVVYATEEGFREHGTKDKKFCFFQHLRVMIVLHGFKYL